MLVFVEFVEDFEFFGEIYFFVVIVFIVGVVFVGVVGIGGVGFVFFIEVDVFYGEFFECGIIL